MRGIKNKEFDAQEAFKIDKNQCAKTLKFVSNVLSAAQQTRWNVVGQILFY